MKKPNAYLQKKEMFNQALLDVGMDTGFQKCWDLLQCVLNDPEVMGVKPSRALAKVVLPHPDSPTRP